MIAIRQLKFFLLTLVLCGLWVPTAEATVFWIEDFLPGSVDPLAAESNWGFRRDAEQQLVGTYRIVDLGDELFDPTLNGTSAVEIWSGDGGDYAILADFARTDRTRGSVSETTIGMPSEGQSRYLYFWGVYNNEGDARYTFGLDQGDVFNDELASGFGFAHYQEADTLLHRYDDLTEGERSHAPGDYDYRIHLHSPADPDLEVHWQYKPVGTPTWITTHSRTVAGGNPASIDDAADRVIKMAADGGTHRFYIDKVEFSDEDRSGIIVDGDFQWGSTGGGDFFSPFNWTPTGTPGLNNTMTFSGMAQGPSTVFADQAVSASSITFDNSQHRYHIAGSGPFNLTAGDAGDPQIQVLSGDHEFQTEVNLVDNTTMDVATGAALEFENKFSLVGNILTKTGEGLLAFNNQLNTGEGTVDVQGGTILGVGAIGGDLNNVTGSIAPGLSPGILTVGGDFFQQDTGTLEIEIGGTTQGEEYDSLAVTGSAAVDGTLWVSLIDDFVPSAGQQFTVLTSAGLTAGGLTLAGPASDSFNLVVDGSDLVLQSLGSSVAGDYSGNGFVDAADYNIWRDTFGQSVPIGTGADGVANGVIDELDYEFWKGRFGISATATGSGQAVPEPASILLVMLTVVAAGCYRRQAR
jgi:hypothetical protein